MAIIYAEEDKPTYGTGGRDTIYGNELSNRLYGNMGNDRLYGGAGNDQLAGGRGRDTLAGGDGYDDFYFGSAPSKTSIDVITDFNKRYDTILLSGSVFKGLGWSGAWMKASAFWQGSKAHDANDRILYNSKNGIVYYDPDGTGSKEALPIVKIGAGLKMSAHDFWINF